MSVQVLTPRELSKAMQYMAERAFPPGRQHTMAFPIVPELSFYLPGERFPDPEPSTIGRIIMEREVLTHDNGGKDWKSSFQLCGLKIHELLLVSEEAARVWRGHTRR